MKRAASWIICASTRTWYGSRKLKVRAYWFMSLRYCFERLPRMMAVLSSLFGSQIGLILSPVSSKQPKGFKTELYK